MKNKTVYVVLGVMDSGSASLTYPEDFDFQGFYESQKDAQDHCDRLNKENGVVDFGEKITEDDEEDGEGLTEEMVYTVETLEDLKTKK